MKKIVLLALVVVLTVFVASCSTTRPVAGASGVVGSKTGEAFQGVVMGFYLKGEGGIAKAAKNGGIKKVGTVDLRVDWPASPVIPYWIITTVVTGE